jgi:hypothetical protein
MSIRQGKKKETTQATADTGRKFIIVSGLFLLKGEKSKNLKHFKVEDSGLLVWSLYRSGFIKCKNPGVPGFLHLHTSVSKG